MNSLCKSDETGLKCDGLILWFWYLKYGNAFQTFRVSQAKEPIKHWRFREFISKKVLLMQLFAMIILIYKAKHSLKLI